MTLAYRITLTPDDNDTLLVTCPDLPGVVSYGSDPVDAMAHAVDAIEAFLASLIADGRDVPRPALRRKRDEALVRLPALTALKLELYWALRDAGITRAELMRRLGWNRESVDRLFRLDHASRLDQIETALAALGRRVNISTADAA
jgi:antitoxin HicB